MSTAQTFRKKPVEIQAMQVQKPFKEILDWCAGRPLRASNGNAIVGILISTLEGDMRADLGDWIICGVKGEFYPCKPDIFAATYDAVVGNQPKEQE